MRTHLLSPDKIQFADGVARLRTLDNIIHERPGAHGFNEEDRNAPDRVGAACELAFSDLFKIPWTPLTYGLPDLKTIKSDVGGYHVRGTALPAGKLLLHKDDPDDGIFYLVIDRSPEFDVIGWIRAGDGKVEDYWETFTGRPCYMVPWRALVPVE